MHAAPLIFNTRLGERILVLPPKVKAEPDNQFNLFDMERRTASPDEKDKWLADILEIALTMKEVWPSDLHAKLTVLPYDDNWIGAVFHKLSVRGYYKDYQSHRKSRNVDSNGREEFCWRKR